MRLFSLSGTAAVSHPEHGTFEADEDGGFDLPEALGSEIYAIHLAGSRVWETESERIIRLAHAEQERLRDPATLLAAVASLTDKIAGNEKQPEKPAAKKAAAVTKKDS